MRAITVRQPWAWAIAEGWKGIENRGQNIAGAHRGPVAIHAGLAWDLGAFHDPTLAPLLANLGIYRGNADGNYFREGAVIAVVDLVDVHPGWMEPKTKLCSPWAIDYVKHAGQHHLVLANPRPLATPVPAKGRLGLWTLPDDVEVAVLAQFGAVS